MWPIFLAALCLCPLMRNLWQNLWAWQAANWLMICACPCRGSGVFGGLGLCHSATILWNLWPCRWSERNKRKTCNIRDISGSILWGVRPFLFWRPPGWNFHSTWPLLLSLSQHVPWQLDWALRVVFVARFRTHCSHRLGLRCFFKQY